MKKFITTILLATFTSYLIAGCSTASKDISPTYVSPTQYSNYDCEQIRQDLLRVSGRVNEMTGKLDKNRENDNVTTTAGIILFWPALFFLGGTKEQEAEYARLKGEYNALEQTSIIKKCALNTSANPIPTQPNTNTEPSVRPKPIEPIPETKAE